MCLSDQELAAQDRVIERSAALVAKIKRRVDLSHKKFEKILTDELGEEHCPDDPANQQYVMRKNMK